jgi:hypothetical protein
MIAVRDGFNLGIDPNYYHTCKFKLMIHNENISKHKTLQ